NNYLKFRLQKLDLWKTQERKAQNVFENIQAYYYDMIALSPGPGRESELEDKFIRPVLSALGFKYSVEPVTERGYKAKKRPDYALFKDSESLESASADKNNPRKFFSNALTIVEAKYWGRRLNDMDKTDSLDSRDPTAQAVKYLEDVHYHSEGRINWAILTNGKLWRLFYYRASSKSGNFYEVDLEKIITNNDISSFLYFYLFFSKDAFIEDSTTGKSWLDLHLKSSEDYAVRVSEKLKFLIFDKIFETLAEGFLHYRKTELFITVETEESKKKMFKGCLTFLYRLLFLLYAESRNLLPMDNDSYRGVSLSALKGDIVSDISKHGIGGMSKRLFKYWARLEGLFSIISKGEPAMNLPVYNGGLFEVSEDNILKDHRIPDPFIAEVVELLTVDTDDEHSVDSTSFIDYSSLGVRHLGDIYEGLLEFHLQIAGEAVAEAKEKGKSVWKKVSELKSGIKTGKRKETGDAYIENSKHERKTSGSYYTPPYIVEYIVKNTVGQVLDEKFMKAGNLISELSAVKSLIKKQKSTSSIQNYAAEIKRLEDAVFETVFDIRVLDPAIGSGHFLVHTVDFISDRIAAFLSKHPENPVINRIYSLKREIMEEIARQGVRIDENKLTETSLIKRVVLKRCIYGVDLNDMAVELAKLSLWLDSFTSGAPLSFLDHHLKCGNSLIGVMDISSVVLPNSEAFSKVQRALSFMIQVSELTDATVDETQKSKKFFKEADSELAPIRRRFDVHIAKHFMVTGNNISRLERLASTLDFDNEPYPEVVKACKDALLIAKEKHFFHWKLEFPEV
ncbi:MAG: hypothetical protein HQK92_16870, partial [Nitrospirae bacterium]|nr:hypothetical protein [Nitrospirota bacterium]